MIAEEVKHKETIIDHEGARKQVPHFIQNQPQLWCSNVFIFGNHERLY